MTRHVHTHAPRRAVLLVGKYHPAISSYRGGSVTLNFGPDFRFAPPPRYRPMSDANDLPLWVDIQKGLAVRDGHTWSLAAAQAAGEDEQDFNNNTPGPSSSVDGEADDDSSEQIAQADLNGERALAAEAAADRGGVTAPHDDDHGLGDDADEVLGAQALLSLGGGGDVLLPTAVPGTSQADFDGGADRPTPRANGSVSVAQATAD